MILEGIVTTLSADDVLNIAPMGPRISSDLSMSRFILRPYRTSTTYQNLKIRGEGVFHITDDVLLLAQSAIGIPLDPPPPTRPASAISGWYLRDACRYYEFRTVDIDDHDERTTITVETVAQGRLRDFLGFNRARHAVVEAAILATRTAFLPLPEILAEMNKLAIVVQKTGGPVEHAAFQLLRQYVLEADRSRLAPDAPRSP